MFTFSFAKASDEASALEAGAAGDCYIAGDTTLVDLMRVPWWLPAVEGALTGRQPSPELWRTAATRAADGATSLSENGFKVELVKRTFERQLATVAGQL